MLLDANKSILILKSSSQGLGPAEIFLKNRDWKIRATTDIKEALLYIIQEQPPFVMISMDHPNSLVLKLPRILKQAFPACVIAYAEKTLPSSLNALSQAGTEYVLYPPIAGAAFERVAHKYCRDVLTRKVQPGGNSTLTSLRGPLSPISVQGGSYVSSDIQRVLTRLLEDAGLQDILPRSTEVPPAPALNLRTPEELHADPRAVKKDSIILRGARLALETACQTESNLRSRPIGVTTKVRCTLVESLRFSGYLVTAMASDEFEENFMKTVRDRLGKFLAENGETLGKGATWDLKIKPVPFERWALKDAEFLRKSVHQGQDVAMAFFPSTSPTVDFLESPAHDMVALDIDELTCDMPVEFNLYVHLPLNDRFLLYTPKGGIFYENQKNRLAHQGVSRVHIKKADVTEVPRYRAQNFINQKIRAFEENPVD